MLTEPHIFPRTLPPGYTPLDNEPAFDPATDLALEEPAAVTTLNDLRYSDEFQRAYGSSLAVTAPFRVLSDTGLAKLRAVITRLQPYIIRIPGHPRVPGTLRGAAYRSRFIRDLSLSSQVVAFFSKLGAMDLVPTSYPHQLAHMNFPPEDLTEPAPGWHFDENAFVMVLMVHDPDTLDGGRFQYFDGTRTEGIELLKAHGDIPAERCVTPVFPGGGYAVLMQGSTVVHRGAPLRAPAERITMVTSYDTRDVGYPDPNRMHFVSGGLDEADPNARLERACRAVEYARHKAWRIHGKLDDFLRDVDWTDDRDRLIARLESTVRETIELIDTLQRGDTSVDELGRHRETAHV